MSLVITIILAYLAGLVFCSWLFVKRDYTDGELSLGFCLITWPLFLAIFGIMDISVHLGEFVDWFWNRKDEL